MRGVRICHGGRILSLGVGLALILVLADVAPTGAATVTNIWRAQIGSVGANGTATVEAYTSGSGSIVLRLAKLKASTYLPVTLSKGTCSRVVSTLIRFPAIRTTSTGHANRTSSLTAGQVTLVMNATAETGQVAIRVGSATAGGLKCGAFTIRALCGRSASAPATAAPSTGSGTLAKSEPPDGYAYFGFLFRLWDESPPSANVMWGDTRPLAERICDSVAVELAGKTPAIIKVQSEWRSPDGTPQPFRAVLGDIEKIHGALGSDVVPMLEWQADTGTGSDSAPGTYTGITTKDIASGSLDTYIRQYARDVKAHAKPLFIRLICGEFNGNWWQWCSPLANPALTTADFVKAWRRVVDIFRHEGVTNVAWLWIPVTPTPPSQDWGFDPGWQAYYPGDAYVDRVGSDLNDWGQPSWLDPVYQFGVDRGKPFFLAEFGIRHDGTGLTHVDQVRWLTAMFDYFESHPQIKAIIYCNYKLNPDRCQDSVRHVWLYDGQVNYVPDVNDLDQRLLAGGADIRALFATRIAESRHSSTLVTGK